MTLKFPKCNSICKINTHFPEKLDTYQNVLEEQKKAYYIYYINKNSNYNQDKLKATNSLSLVNSIDNRLVNLNKNLKEELKSLTNQTLINKKNIFSNKTKIKELISKVNTLQNNEKKYDNMIVSAKYQKTNQLSNKKYAKLEYYSSKILIIILLLYFLFALYSLVKILIV